MKQVIIPLLLFSFSVSQFQSEAQNRIDPKPNIILILTDDQGWGDVAINGNTTIATPNIDNLARNGVTFCHFYACPVCSPTRAEILTGRYHVRSGVFETSTGGERLNADEITLAGLLKNAGYKTALYGKWHSGMQPPYHPNARGFDDFYGFCSGHWGNYFSPLLEHNGSIVQGEGFTTDDFTSRGIKFIEQNRNNPFFLFLAFNTPHSPMQVPPEYWEKYKNREIKQRTDQVEKEDIEFTRAALAMCENIDFNVGRVTKKVTELGLAENTIIIYLSDNGPAGFRWNGGMKGKKGATDEGGIRVPFFIQWDGKFKKGKQIGQIAAVIDLLPTLTDLAGIDCNTRCPVDGKSLKPLLLSEDDTWNDRLIFSHWQGKISVRNQKFRLSNDDKLYDIENDPGQKTDVATKFPDIFAQLTNAKNRWKNEVASELKSAEKPFTIGCPGFVFTQLPARDAIPHGNIKRSNQYPNSTYFTNWISTTDSITWNAEVLEDGLFEVEMYYSCNNADIGSDLELSMNGASLNFKLNRPNDAKLIGPENDIYPRMEGYEKEFRPITMGTVRLKKGNGLLTLRAKYIPGKQALEFRTLVLKRIAQ